MAGNLIFSIRTLEIIYVAMLTNLLLLPACFLRLLATQESY